MLHCKNNSCNDICQMCDKFQSKLSDKDRQIEDLKEQLLGKEQQASSTYSILNNIKNTSEISETSEQAKDSRNDSAIKNKS